MKKTIAELFAGVGGFRVGFERLKSDWETVWFSQWEPGTKKQWAHDCYVSHFGDLPDLKGNYTTGIDIAEVNKKDIPDHNLLVGGFPCLTGDTLILTDKSLKKITDIQIGDKVLSHDKRYHKVTNIFNQGEKQVFKIRGYSFDSLYATGNHKFYVKKLGWRYTPKKTRTFSDPLWMSVDEIMNFGIKNIYFGIAVNQNSVLPDLNYQLDITNKSLWYLAGRYFGRGYLIKSSEELNPELEYNAIVIPNDKRILKKLKNKIKNKFGFKIISTEESIDAVFHSSELAEFMKLFGTDSKNKLLPAFLYDMPVEYLEKFIEGYLDCCGSVQKDKINFTFDNKKLAYGMSILCEKVYHKACQISFISKSYFVCIDFDKHFGYYTFCEDGYIWYPLLEITKDTVQQVYDIEVEESHSFIANRTITHNCQDYSVAHTLKSSKGIEGKKGVLWWQIYEVLKAKKPPFCLFENVDRLLKSPAKQRGRDFGIMLACLNELNYDVEWRVVNAAEYGAGQKRKRIFIFCWKQNTNYSTEINKYNEKDIFLTQGMFAKAFPILEITEINSTKIPVDIIQTSDNFKFDFKNSGYMHNGIIYTTTPTPLTEESITLGSIIEKNVDDKYTVSDEKLDKWKYLKGSKKIPRKDKNGFEYMYTEGAMAFPDNLNKPARTMLTSEGTLNRTSHIILDPQTNKYRILTPVETERIQGFDDNWTEGMTDRMRRFCMGNSLVVPMITRMGRVINDIVEKEN